MYFKAFLLSFFSRSRKNMVPYPTGKDTQFCYPASLCDQGHKNVKKKFQQQIKMSKSWPLYMPEENKRCGSCSTLQPPILIHHPKLHGPLKNAIQARASNYIADIPPAHHHTDTRKYLIIKKEPVFPLLPKTYGTSFKPVWQVSDLWDKKCKITKTSPSNLSCSEKFHPKNNFLYDYVSCQYCEKLYYCFLVHRLWSCCRGLFLIRVPCLSGLFWSIAFEMRLILHDWL